VLAVDVAEGLRAAADFLPVFGVGAGAAGGEGSLFS
jgi:hypothetical protein